MKLALPKGRLMKDTAALLQEAGLGLDDYNERSRSYRLSCARFPDLSLKVFHERDVPIQVAIGNYDLGICGGEWVEELLSKYPSGDLVKVRGLGYGRSDIYAAVSAKSGASSAEGLDAFDMVRIVSEYQNLAESFALKRRLKRFSILPICGAGEAYPPESADLVIIADTSVSSFADFDLIPLSRMLSSSACLIANKNSLKGTNLSELLACLQSSGSEPQTDAPALEGIAAMKGERSDSNGDTVRLALPDGHQQQPTMELLKRAGFEIKGYSQPLKTRRPTAALDGVSVKVIRPQDMPLQVANGNFDLAITGEDWLKDHLCRFPSSPVQKTVALGFGKVKLVAVVGENSPAFDARDLRELVDQTILPPLRVASEYVNIADKYARDNHLARYKIVPTWGASEAFLPEDADLLIENTETGETLKKHKLRVIDTLFESSACLIGHRDALAHPSKKGRIENIISIIKRGCQ